MSSVVREIKFRCFIPSVNKMVYDPYIKTPRTHISNLFNGTHNKGIWMQYTGLKDMNGMGIYEGDILKYGNTEHYIVIFDQEYASFMVSQQHQHYHLDKDEPWEVIGNRYENPELVTTEDN